MWRATCALSLILTAAALLTGCGAAADDRYILVDVPGSGSLDSQLRQALTDAGVTRVPVPPAESPALQALGRALFFDKILSGNENISCATCHHPVAATGDALPVSLGEGGGGVGATREQGEGVLIPRNAPHLFNAGVSGVSSMFWDSRVQRDASTGELTTPEPGLNGAAPSLLEHAAPLDSALAAQAMFPVTSAAEMRGQPTSNPLGDLGSNEQIWRALMERLVGTGNGTSGGIQGYRDLFAAAYPSVTDFDDFTFGHAARAIGAFERETWTALDTSLDRYLAGDSSALSDAAKRGGLLFFGEASCSACHSGPLLSDFQHHAVCVPQVGPGKEEVSEDRGLALITGSPEDDYKFRTPPLRNVALTGPWMHDGAFTSLEAAVRHHLDPQSSLDDYDATQLPPPFDATLDTDASRNAARAAALDPLHPAHVDLSAAEFADLMAFLYALTDPASLNLLAAIPATVPSGLAVRD